MVKENQTMPPVHPSTGKAPIQISRILSCKSSISASMARLIGAALGTSAQYWVNLQAHYDLEVADLNSPPLTVKPLVIGGKRVTVETLKPASG